MLGAVRYLFILPPAERASNIVITQQTYSYLSILSETEDAATSRRPEEK